MLSTALVALDATVIATAVPSIVRDVGGFTRFPWLFSAYLLTQAVTVPLYGRFADVVGRRPVLLLGIALFVGGSLLCGAAPSMPVLIGARALQGLGAGAVQPMSMTVIGDLYTVEERARVQGYIAGVWGAASVVGPALGGLVSEYLSWRWIFWINLPVGLLAAWMLRRHLVERIEHQRHSIDYAGALLLTAGCSLVILALLQGGVAWPWSSPPGVGVPAAGGGLLVAFVLVERRRTEPVLPLWVFRHRVLLGGNVVAVMIGAVLIGLSSYVPTYAQGVLGAGPLAAGFALAALSIGWPIAATVSGRVYLRLGFRDTALLGAVGVVAGTAAGTALTAHSPLWAVATACGTVGLGLGLVSSPTVVAAQSAVGWGRRGVVTASNMFSRSIGSAVGVAVFGAVANAALTRRLAHPPSGVTGPLPTPEQAGGTVLERATTTPPATVAFLRSALFEASHHVFVGLLVVSVLSVVAVLVIPRRTTPLAVRDGGAELVAGPAGDG